MRRETKGENMGENRSLFSKCTFEVTFYGVDMLGVPKGKGILKEKIVLDAKDDENKAIAEVRKRHPEIPENVHVSARTLPSNDLMADDR